MSQSPDTENSLDGTKLRVLVVDDEPTLRLGFAYALSSRTTTVETAPTGQLALERIAEMKFDIMILDLRMPELDGLGVIETLRGQENYMSIVLCSAAISPHSALQAIRQGVFDFLLKPVRPVDLREVVEFIRQPGRGSLARAMHAARNRRPEEAIYILTNETSRCPQAAGWLSVLESLHDPEVATGGIVANAKLEESIRKNLPFLAFNPVTSA